MALKKAGRPLTLRPSEYPLQIELPYKGVTQNGNTLCWAACVVSAASSRGNRSLSQARLARLFIRSCRRPPRRRRRMRGSRCDRALAVDRMVNVWVYAGFPNAEKFTSTNNLGQLFINELANDRPVQVWVDQFHAVMVYGYRRRDDGKEKVLVMDPQAGFGDGWRAIGTRARWSAVWIGLSYEEPEQGGAQNA